MATRRKSGKSTKPDKMQKTLLAQFLAELDRKAEAKED